MKRRLAIILVCLTVFMLCGCCLSHEWQEATCTEPKTCSKCGKTEGEALGHTWEEATCTKAKKCSVCGQIEGQPLGHKWEKATCTKPKTCSICGQTEGKPLEHDYNWETVKEPTVVLEGEEKGVCSVCGDTTTRTIKKLTPEYYWGVPVEYGNITVEFYKEDDMYCFKMEGPYKSTELMQLLSYDAIPDMQMMIRQMNIVLDNYKDAYKSDGITYAIMEGYGRKWVFFADMSDNSPGIIGLKVNLEKEMKACALMHIVD